MSTAIGDLVASLGMNISPAQTAIGNAQEMFQRFSERTAGIMAKVKGSMGSLTTGLGMGVGIGAVLAGAEGVKSFFMDSIGLAQDSAKEQKKLGILLTATGASADLVPARSASLPRKWRRPPITARRPRSPRPRQWPCLSSG